jgi:hypothetical protein
MTCQRSRSALSLAAVRPESARAKSSRPPFGKLLFVEREDPDSGIRRDFGLFVWRSEPSLQLLVFARPSVRQRVCLLPMRGGLAE